MADMSNAMSSDEDASNIKQGIVGDDDDSADAAGRDRDSKKSRAFVACANCRRAKAKCDLGDVNNPKDPPCARCRRRTIPCNFLPSRRSGRMSYEARQASRTSTGENTSDQVGHSTTHEPAPGTAYSYLGADNAVPSSNTEVLDAAPSVSPAVQAFQNSSWPSDWQRLANDKGLMDPQPLPAQPFQEAGPSSSQWLLNGEPVALATSQAGFRQDENSRGSHDEYPLAGRGTALFRSTATIPSIDKSHKRRAREKDEDRVEELAAANLRNPVDAMSLLVLAAGERKDASGNGNASGRKRNRANTLQAGPNHRNHDSRTNAKPTNGGEDEDTGSSGSRADDDENETRVQPDYHLSDFPLVKRGVLNPIEVFYFVNLFFTKVHHIFPLVPHHRIPRTEAQLTAFAQAEVHLTTVFILIASRLDQGTGNQGRVHEGTWVYMQELITKLVFGEEVTVGAVEALLLLSENPPRALASAGNHREDFAEENRMSWIIVGLAVRLGYMLSLDQISFLPVRQKGKENIEALMHQERERIAWTYCFLFDRQIAIRTGKAFWSRGPGLMFSGSSADYFPSLRPVPGVQDDYASLLQAYAELTQILQNSQDILYPSKDRSTALVSAGEYHKHLDSFTRALNTYRATWEVKKWETFPLTECVWVTFHYVRLYIYAFAFQASVQRGIQRAQGSSVEAVKAGIFKQGAMSSPDARFLMEAVEAACDMLRICTDRLHPQNVLQYLPWRFFLYFSYAGVFLLKAIFLNAVAAAERRNTVRLLRRLIICLAGTSSDPHQHAVRYARLLDSLLRTFSRDQDGVDTSSPHEQPSFRSRPRTEPRSSRPQGDGDWPVSRAPSPEVPLSTAPGRRNEFDRVEGIESANIGRSGDAMLFASDATGSTRVASAANRGSFSDISHNQSYPPSASDLGPGSAYPGTFSYNQPTSLGPQPAASGSGTLPTYSPLSDNNSFLPLEAYTNLLDDTTLDFWTALTNTQDWATQGSIIAGGEFLQNM